MTISQKCVSLETAKKLKEAGFPQDTERWFVDTRKSWKEYNGQFISYEESKQYPPESVHMNGDGGLYTFKPFEGIQEGDGELELSDRKDGMKGYNNSEPLAAPDATELGELLPVSVENDSYWLTTFKCTRKGWWVVYCKEGENPSTSKNCKESIWSLSESEARAACYIWLKEHKFI